MNRSKRQLTVQDQKKMQKTVRKAQKNYPASKKLDESDALTKKEMIKKFPKKPLTKQKANLVKIAAEPKKSASGKKKSVSKRTNPGTVPSSTPASPHREGDRWIKTLTSQTQATRRIETRKAIKRK